MIVADTNVLVGAFTPAAPFHQRPADALTSFSKRGPLVVSRQILREFLMVITRPQPWGMPEPVQAAMSKIDRLTRPFQVMEDGPAVWAELRGLADRVRFGGKQVHDANIVATMLSYGRRRLLTFNAADFRRFASVIEGVEP